MRFSNYRGIFYILLLILSGCSSASKFSDLNDFIAEVGSRPKGKIQPLPPFEPYQAFTYGAKNLRSPFVPPIVIKKLGPDQIKNRDLKPPANHKKQFLERFNLATLNMVGTLSKEDSTWALIKDMDGGIHRVKVGDYMGSNFGQVESIKDDQLDLTEIVDDGQGGWQKRPRTLDLVSVK